MRDIKFRFWDTIENEWMVDGKSETNIYDFAFKKDMNWNFINKQEALERVIILQYTGLKDKNGKEIYEGDVVRCWGGEYCQGYWEFDETIIIKDLTRDCFMIGERGNIQVIGNIYDNPELLKEVLILCC